MDCWPVRRLRLAFDNGEVMNDMYVQSFHMFVMHFPIFFWQLEDEPLQGHVLELTLEAHHRELLVNILTLSGQIDQEYQGLCE